MYFRFLLGSFPEMSEHGSNFIDSCISCVDPQCCACISDLLSKFGQHKGTGSVSLMCKYCNRRVFMGTELSLHTF
jgi:aspartate carbamoyltransferase regulatory subunit